MIEKWWKKLNSNNRKIKRKIRTRVQRASRIRVAVPSSFPFMSSHISSQRSSIYMYNQIVKSQSGTRSKGKKDNKNKTAVDWQTCHNLHSTRNRHQNSYKAPPPSISLPPLAFFALQLPKLLDAYQTGDLHRVWPLVTSEHQQKIAQPASQHFLRRSLHVHIFFLFCFYSRSIVYRAGRIRFFLLFVVNGDFEVK